MKKLSALISTLRIFKTMSSKPAEWLQDKSFVNVENLCVAAHIKSVVKITHSCLIVLYSSRK